MSLGRELGRGEQLTDPRAGLAVDRLAVSAYGLVRVELVAAKKARSKAREDVVHVRVRDVLDDDGGRDGAVARGIGGADGAELGVERDPDFVETEREVLEVLLLHKHLVPSDVRLDGW